MNPILTDIVVPAADPQASVKERFLRTIATMPPNTVPNTLRVFLVREPFDDFYTVINQNGHTEELEEDDVRRWLAEHGASEELVHDGVTQAWNFYSAMLLIKNPKHPVPVYDPLSPRLDSL